MDWSIIVALLGIIIGYVQFKHKLNQELCKIRMQIWAQQYKTYKELILSERIKRHNKILEAARNLLSYLNQYSFAMEHKHSLEKTFFELDREIAKQPSQSDSFIDLYEQLVREDGTESDGMEHCIMCIDQEFYFLTLIFGNKYQLPFTDIRHHISDFIVKGFLLKKANESDCFKLETELSKIEDDLIHIFRKLVDEDWNDIKQQAQKIFVDAIHDFPLDVVTKSESEAGKHEIDLDMKRFVATHKTQR